MSSTRSSTSASAAELRQRLREDYPFYARTVLKVLDRQKLVTFELRPAQQRLCEVLARQKAQGQPMRAVILKARKLGFSTLAQGLLLQRTTLTPMHRAIIVAHNQTTAGAIVEMAETMHRHLPDIPDPELLLKPPIVGRRRFKELRFGVGDATTSLLIDTAREFEAGRGHTFQSIHGSEVAFWPDLRRKLTALLNAVDNSDPDTLVLLESTANGHNEFKRYWDQAQEGSNDFYPFFAAWHEDLRYVRKFASPKQRQRLLDGLDADERDLVERYELSAEQLNWRRWAMENLCGADISIFRQEYPSFPEEAFMASGQGVFSSTLIQKAMRHASAQPEPARVRLTAISTTPRRTRRGSVDVPTAVKATEGDGPWEIWTPPSHSQYVISCDPATGESDDGAAFAAVVIDHHTREQCAQLEVQWEPDLVATELLLICLYYSQLRRPWLAIERTGGFGLAMIDVLYHEYAYRQMYTRRRADAPTGDYSDRLGWDTTRTTKGILHEEAMQLLREGTHGIKSLRLAKQMETYVKRGSGRTGPTAGARSDLLMAWMIAQAVANEKQPRPDRQPGQVKRINPRRIRYAVTGY